MCGGGAFWVTPGWGRGAGWKGVGCGCGTARGGETCGDGVYDLVGGPGVSRVPEGVLDGLPHPQNTMASTTGTQAGTLAGMRAGRGFTRQSGLV